MNIMNYYEFDEMLSSGGQPTPEQIDILSKNGTEVIVNLSPETTPNYLANESNLVDGLGMKYIHFPVDCSNLESVHYEVFQGIMNGLKDKKVFVHCGGNIKSSNLIHAWSVLAAGKDEAKSLETLLKIQQPESKWFSYFKSLGMLGLQ